MASTMTKRSERSAIIADILHVRYILYECLPVEVPRGGSFCVCVCRGGGWRGVQLRTSCTEVKTLMLDIAKGEVKP